jgi:hypothetical protein
MPRRAARPTATETQPGKPDESAPEPAPAPPTPAAAAAVGSLADLPVAGLTRRRIGFLVGAVLAAWVVILFARQVSEASEATSRADTVRASNVQLQDDVLALQQELELIQRQQYIEQQAREYRLGSPREVPFVLGDGAPPLAADAPGMAAVRLGAQTDRPTPLESWLDLLFGSGQPDGR